MVIVKLPILSFIPLSTSNKGEFKYLCPTYMQVVEQCDIEREDLPPFDRIGETQVSKEILVFFYHCLIIFSFVEI